MNYISDELRKKISGNMKNTSQAGKGSFEFTGNGRVWIRQDGWGTLEYDLDDLANEIKSIQSAGKGTVTPKEAADRIYVLKAAQEALIGR